MEYLLLLGIGIGVLFLYRINVVDRIDTRFASI